jgi:phosphoenolpyruvate phosphomutase
VIGVNDGLSALLASRAGFDALWASGLGICASHGVPDASILSMSDFAAAAGRIVASSNRPVIADCDTGFGDANVLREMIRLYERAGVAAVCIEDKEFPKRNSFSTGQKLAPVEEFSAKIALAKEAQRDPDFMVVARLESLIAGAGQEDAFERACCYAQCGADALLIHSKATDAGEVLAFAERWAAEDTDVPLFAIPTTYPTVTETDLGAGGISAIIYANQALRAAYEAMELTMRRILEAGTAAVVEADIARIDAVLELIGMEEINVVDASFAAFVQHMREERRAVPAATPTAQAV